MLSFGAAGTGFFLLISCWAGWCPSLSWSTLIALSFTFLHPPLTNGPPTYLENLSGFLIGLTHPRQAYKLCKTWHHCLHQIKSMGRMWPMRTENPFSLYFYHSPSVFQSCSYLLNQYENSLGFLEPWLIKYFSISNSSWHKCRWKFHHETCEIWPQEEILCCSHKNHRTYFIGWDLFNSLIEVNKRIK